MPFGLHPAYLIILLAIVLIIFGPGKLPELGGAVGRGMREFRRAQDGLTRAPEEEPPATAVVETKVAEAAKAVETKAGDVAEAAEARAADANAKAKVESKPEGA